MICVCIYRVQICGTTGKEVILRLKISRNEIEIEQIFSDKIFEKKVLKTNQMHLINI